MKIKIIYLILIQFICFNAITKNWLSVRDNIYVDLTSQERNGEIGIVNIKFNGQLSKPEIDCKNRILIKLLDLDVPKQAGLLKTMDIPCKKWFEVWN